MDRELRGRKPAEWPHREVVGAAVEDSELLGEVVQRVEAAAGVKAFLVLSVAALYFAVVAGRVRTDELVPDAQLHGCGFKEGGQVTPAVGETVGELKAIVGLDALHTDAPAVIPLPQLYQEVCRGVGGLLRVGSQEAQTGKLINGGVLVQAELRVCNTSAGHYFHIHLDPLAGIGHLLVRFGFARLFLLSCGKQAQFPHDPEQALRASGIATLAQPVPQLHHTKVWIAAAHIPDQLQLRLCVLVGMAVGASGLAGQGLHRSIPAGLPEVDVRPALVILPAGTAHAVFLCICHQGLPICHVLCYTLAHEGYGPLSLSCCPQLQL